MFAYTKRHASAVENQVGTTAEEIRDIYEEVLPSFPFENAEASLPLIYTLTTVLVWKSRSFILCYSLVIDATLN